jgi:hypothetical protein
VKERGKSKRKPFAAGQAYSPWQPQDVHEGDDPREEVSDEETPR